MECRFCNVARATFLNLPTDFGLADLCERCARRYSRYVRRRPRREHSKRNRLNETSGPGTAARFNLNPNSRKGFKRDDNQSNE